MLKAIYQEDDWIAEVEILKDNSNDNIEDYELKVIKTMRESRIYNPTSNGTIFKVWQDKSNPIVFTVSGLGKIE